MSGRLYQRITTSWLGTTRRAAGRRRDTRGLDTVGATRHDLTHRLPAGASRPPRLY